MRWEIKSGGNSVVTDNKKEKSISLLYNMILIREFENAVSEYKVKKVIYGSAHCYNGEEAVAAGICAALKKEDYIISNHRPHGHAIAKGIDINSMMAEIFGRATGTNRGKGGSMHVNDASIGMIVSTGIVGSGIPVACGAAFSAKYKQNGKIACVFFGDGAANEETLHESMNLAAKWQLPVIFVLEDNELAVTTKTRTTSACNDYVQMANAYSIEGNHVDGQDVEQVYAIAEQAVETARNKSNPFLIQAHTIRFNEHAEGEYYFKMRDKNYRDYEALEKDKVMRCPIKGYEKRLLMDGTVTEELIHDLHLQAEKKVRASIEYALNSPEPEKSIVFQNIFAEV